MSDWLKNLKVGDTVIIEHRSSAAVDTIARLTKTQFVLSSNYKFNRTTGYEVGGDTWNTTSISEATFERVCQVTANKKKTMLANKIMKLAYENKLMSLSLKSLETIAEIMEIK